MYEVSGLLVVIDTMIDSEYFKLGMHLPLCFFICYVALCVYSSLLEYFCLLMLVLLLHYSVSARHSKLQLYYHGCNHFHFEQFGLVGLGCVQTILKQKQHPCSKGITEGNWRPVFFFWVGGWVGGGGGSPLAVVHSLP